MVDTLIFLAKDYSKEELQDMIIQLNAYVEFYNGYYARLYKTTDKAFCKRKLSDWEIPREIIEKEMSPDLIEVFDHYVSYERKSVLNKHFLGGQESKFSLMFNELEEIAKKYFANNDDTVSMNFEPGKYVVWVRLHSQVGAGIKQLLEKMGFECSHVIHWLDDEFSKEAFEYVDLAKKPLEVNTYLFWLEKPFSEDGLKAACKQIIHAFKSLRHGVYVLNRRIPINVMAALTDDTEMITVPDEYERYCEFKRIVWDRKNGSIGNESVWKHSLEEIENELADYRKHHKVYDEIPVLSEQQVLEIKIIREDYDEVKKIIENAGLHIIHESLKREECVDNKNNLFNIDVFDKNDDEYIELFNG